MSNKHTPGPWKISRQKKKKGMISMPPLIESANPRPGDGETVCSMGGGIVHFANGEANARLISAAPDLLEIVRELSLWYNEGTDERSGPFAYGLFGDEDETTWAERVQNVLAKAGGAAS